MRGLGESMSKMRAVSWECKSVGAVLSGQFVESEKKNNYLACLTGKSVYKSMNEVKTVN